MAGFMTALSRVRHGALRKKPSVTETLREKLDEQSNLAQAYYLQLGMHYYTAYGEQPHDERAELLIGSIRSCVMNCEQYQEQLQALRGMIRCRRCGGEVDAGSAYCHYCGTRLCSPETPRDPESDPLPDSAYAPLPSDAVHTASPPTRVRGSARAPICGDCGQPLESESVFCGYCGAKSPVGGV